MQRQIQKLFSLICCLTLVGSIVFFDLKTFADGINVTISPTTRNVSTTGTITLTIPITVALTGTDSITLSINNNFNTTSFAATINGNATTNTSSVVEGQKIYVISANGFAYAIGNLTLDITGAVTPAAQGNYFFSVQTSQGDYGSATMYVGNSNENLVQLIVPPALSFSIRNSTDTAEANTCDLGVFATTSVKSCAYRIKVSTNNALGYTISVKTDGDFKFGSYSFSNAATGSAGSGGTNITAGTEKYGILVNAGSLTSGGNSTVSSIFNAGNINYASLGNIVTPVNLITTNNFNGPNTIDTTNTVLVTHAASISSSTVEGVFIQNVTYTVRPNF
jgi:hypothetical protein